MTIDYYNVLEVNKDSSLADIKASYRKLARQYHPDVNPDASATERFKTITMAYQTLSDPDKKRSYDTSHVCLEILEARKQKIKEKLSQAKQQQSTQTKQAQNTYAQTVLNKPATSQSPSTQNNQTSVKKEEAVTDFFDSFASIFKEAIGNWKPAAEVDKGRKKAIPVQLSPSEKRHGVTKEIEVYKKMTCASCKKLNSPSKNCQKCSGTGSLRVKKILTLSFPPNTKTGEILRLENLGDNESVWVEIV